MKSTIIISLAGVLLPMASAVNMTFYAPQKGVDAKFGCFYEAYADPYLYTASKLPLRFTDTFADY